MRALPLLLALSACGTPANFAGSYTGPFEVTGSCEDGRAMKHNYTARWEVTQKGERLSILTNGSCGTWTATADGDAALVDDKDCDESGGNGYLWWPRLTGASLSLTDGGVHAVGGFHDKATTPALDGGTTTCTTLLDAQLKRQ